MVCDVVGENFLRHFRGGDVTEFGCLVFGGVVGRWIKGGGDGARFGDAATLCFLPRAGRPPLDVQQKSTQ